MQVVQILKGDENTLKDLKEEQKPQILDIENCDAFCDSEENNTTEKLNDKD